MKNIFFLTILIILLSIFTTKYGKTQSSDNYYVIKDSLKSYYNAHPDLIQEEDGGYKHFVRWQEFWKTRVDSYDSAYRGQIGNYAMAYDQYLRDKIIYESSPLISSDWHTVGPTEVPGQWNGLVSSVYVDLAADTTLHTIYIGTSSSGIWKTVDGGQLGIM